MADRHRTVCGRALVVGILVTVAVACASLVPQQAWDHAHGPVVPHDSFPTDCTLCHVEGSWNEIRDDFVYDHAAETGVPLEGAHANAPCLRCHNDRGPVAKYAARGCGGCHIDIHRNNLGPDCAVCHDQNTWQPRGMIRRHNQTRFPLVGAHAVAACWSCHPGAQDGNFAGADVACLTCHGDDLARATVPDHQANGWIDDCQRCHVPFDWRPARFPHPSSFPLTGGHGGRLCTDCHQPGNFQGLSTDCQDCHLDEYQAAVDPRHPMAGFSTNCTECHAVTVWSDASRFRHPQSFPLTGGHALPSCTVCHVGESYTGTPNQCVDCHLDDFQATTSPNHVQSGFPTDCAQCHGTTTWRGARFDHTFPITGDHRFDCAECHRTPANPAQFSCTHCHDHRQSEMDDKHREVGGYSWSSPACVMCHPTGR